MNLNLIKSNVINDKLMKFYLILSIISNSNQIIINDHLKNYCRQRIEEMKTNVNDSMKKQTAAASRTPSPYPASRASRASRASETSDSDEPELRAQRIVLANTKLAIDHLKSVTGNHSAFPPFKLNVIIIIDIDLSNSNFKLKSKLLFK